MPMLALPVALVSDSAAPCTTCSLRHLTLRSCALERGVPFLTDSSMVLNASSSGPRVISMGWMRLGRWSNAVDDEEGTSVLHALVVLVQQLELVVREVRPIQLENLPEGREVDGLRSSMAPNAAVARLASRWGVRGAAQADRTAVGHNGDGQRCLTSGVDRSGPGEGAGG